MKYLKKFKTNADYQSYITDKTALKPNVSYVTDDGEVFYSPLVDYSKQYFTIEAVTSGTLKMTFNVSTGEDNTYYSLDGGSTWSRWSDIPVTPFQLSLSQGDKVMFKKNDVTTAHISGGTAQINLSGNIMSMRYGDNFANQTTLTEVSIFQSMFRENNKVISAENLILPATTLTKQCYYQMFSSCTSLTTAPELPATTLAESCYSTMFNRCSSLTVAPELPATTLAKSCYYQMFIGCTSLTTAPALQATTLEQSCYSSMFSDCSNLTTAPELPATTLTQWCYNNMFSSCIKLTAAPELPALTLVDNCYYYMFWGCTRLNYVKMLATDISASQSTKNWMYNVSATGTFVKNASATWSESGVIPSGWTVETE